MLICLLFLLTASLLAEERHFAVRYLHSYPSSVLEAARQPLGREPEEWHTAGLILFLGGTLYLFDTELNALVLRNRSGLTHALADAGNQFGEGKYMLPALAVTYLGGELLHSAKTMDTALLSVKSFLLANGVSQGLKLLTQRHRPNDQLGKEFWNGSGFSWRRQSFPSGHVTVVWSVAPVLAEQYGDTQWVPPLVYSAALLTSCARLHDNKHWASDVLAGAAIGYFASRLVLKTTPRLTVSAAPDLTGLRFSCEF